MAEVSNGRLLQLNEDVKSVKELLADVSYKQKEMERQMVRQLSSMKQQLDAALLEKHAGETVNCEFQIPLHYPRYTRTDYETMPEAVLDRLLEAYGLPTANQSLDSKRKTAIGTFIWDVHRSDEQRSAEEDAGTLLRRLSSMCKHLILGEL